MWYSTGRQPSTGTGRNAHLSSLECTSWDRSTLVLLLDAAQQTAQKLMTVLLTATLQDPGPNECTHSGSSSQSKDCHSSQFVIAGSAAQPSSEQGSKH